MTNTVKKGFTLIEIVIVLAIAALIMVIVFLAVTGAQRGQRDQARKDVITRFSAKITEFRGNNNGANPATAAEQLNFVTNYVGGATGTPTATSATIGNIQYTISWVGTTLVNTDCNAPGPAATTPNVRPGTGSIRMNTTANPAEVSGCLEAGAVFLAR